MRTIRFRFTGIPAKLWTAVRPACAYGTDLSDPSLYEPTPQGKSCWQYIQQMEKVSDSEIAYTQHFDQDSAFVALRVPW